MRIHEVWVFGSYARGAMEPGDIDLIVVHEKMSDEMRAQLDAQGKAKHLGWPRELYYADDRFKGMVTKPLRKPGEKVDILLGWTLEEVLSHYSTAKNGRLVRLWTPEHRDWGAALASIVPDPEAARAERHEFVPCKRAKCSLEDMDQLTTWIDEGAVTVNRIEPPEWPVKLSATFAHWAEHWVLCRAMGKHSLACLPLGLWWLQAQRVRDPVIGTAMVHDSRYTRTVSFGAIHPFDIKWRLGRTGAIAAAHILHFVRSEPKELLVFQRGSAWHDLDAIVQRKSWKGRS